MAALGAIASERYDSRCSTCGEAGYFVDARLGLKGFVTQRDRRLVCLASLQEPFRKTERMLNELGGWGVDSETFHRISHTEARQASDQRSQRIGSPTAFANATGDIEIQIDAGKINEVERWCDVKVAMFSMRHWAETSSSEDHEQRTLLPPLTQSVIAAVEECALFGERCRAEAKQLGCDINTATVLGDGAEWI